MSYYNYSDRQLEERANELNKRYDPDRLTKPKQADVYDVVDLLKARVAIEYLTPDRTYLGATLFRSGELWIWPGNPFKSGMIPEQKFFHSGTIIIDRDLNESTSEQDEFAENFTVMHECFHFAGHEKTFRHSGHMSRSTSEYRTSQADRNSVLYHIEHQANYGAAAFLMPREAVITAACELLHYDGRRRLPFGYSVKPII